MEATEQARRVDRAYDWLSSEHQRDDGALVDHDEVFPNDPTMMERYLTCSTCGARNVLRMRVRSSSGLTT